MRWPKILALISVFLLLGWGIYDLIIERQILKKDLVGLEANISVLEFENKSLLESIEYFKRPENLLKELKSQFNYRQTGEGLIIIVSTSTPVRK